MTLGLIGLSLMFAIIVWGASHIISKSTSITLSDFIEQGDYEGLSLTIYFCSPHHHIRMPLSVRSLTEDFHEYRVTVQGATRQLILFDMLSNLADVELIPIENETQAICVRIHYVFETENGQNIFDVTWGWGREANLIVNGLAVKENAIFLEVIKPFLPARAAYELELQLNRQDWDRAFPSGQ